LGFGSFGYAPSLLNADFMRNSELTPQISRELRRLAEHEFDGCNGVLLLKYRASHEIKEEIQKSKEKRS
jgi:hypothetical protein